MAVEKFPVEGSHIMMFARSIADDNQIYYDAEHAAATELGKVIAPPTFAQSSAQFDPDYFLRPKIGEDWFGSGKEAKAGKFFPQTSPERERVLEWLFWQVGGLGPMAGQVSHFVNYAPNFPGDHSYSEKRYKDEYDRLLGVMDRVLAEREYLAGEYSIADMASFPWVTAYKRYEVDLDSFANVRRWFDAIKSRPAVRKGIEVGKEVRNFGKGISKESLKTMFNQDAKSISEMAKAKKEE